MKLNKGFGLANVFALLVFGCATVIAQTQTQHQLLTDDAGNTVSQQSGTNSSVKVQKQTPLTAEEKLKYGFRRAFLRPGSYIKPAVGAFFTVRNEPKAPGKTSEDRFADGLSRYARSFGTQTVGNIFGKGIYPIIFKQDPRYFASPKSGVSARILYAASRTFVTRSDQGKTQPNYSRLAGYMTSATFANIYEIDTPATRDAQGRALTFHRRIGVAPTFKRFGGSVATDAASNIVFKEFDLGGKLIKVVTKIFR